MHLLLPRKIRHTGRFGLLLTSAVLSLLISPPSFAATAEQSAPAPAAQERLFNAESFTLDNGMEVIVIPNHRAPVVQHMVWYKVGAADEPEGQSGLAHFVEHLMFKGTENVPPGEFSRIVRALGGENNAFTNQDYTAYYETIARKHLKTVMALEADRMTNLSFPENDVLKERQVVIEERRQRTENDPRGYFFEQMRATLFLNHPYSDPVVGWLHEVDALDRPHVKHFYEQWYAPNNALLIVAGDITAEELKPLAEEIYGVIPAKEVPARDWTGVPPLVAGTTLTLEDSAIRQPMMVRMVRAPSAAQAPEESLALQLLEEAISGDSTTRLYKTLVVEQKMATSASLGYSAYSTDDSYLTLDITPLAGVHLDDAEWALEEVLRDLVTNGITEDELTAAKKRLKDKTVFLLDSLGAPAMIFGRVLSTGGKIEDVENWPTHIENITIEQVNEVIKTYLDPDHYGDRPYVTGYLKPASADPAAKENSTDEAPAQKGDYE